ncbi:MAG: hypothetical protein ACUVTZ_09590 [Armatimonadota bacterium]
MLGRTALVSAQPQPDVGAAGPAEPGMPGMPGGALPVMRDMTAPGVPTAIVATEKYVYVVRGDTLYQFRTEPKLELVTRVRLGADQPTTRRDTAVRRDQPPADQRRDQAN